METVRSRRTTDDTSDTTSSPHATSSSSSGVPLLRLLVSAVSLLFVFSFIVLLLWSQSSSSSFQLLNRASGCILLALVAFAAVAVLIPNVQQKLLHRGLAGRDLNKINATQPIPESLGLVTGVVFLLAGIGTQLLLYDRADTDKLLEFNAGLLAICFMTFLGFADDVLDLPWRYKMILPCCATLPLLLAYRGTTHILVPELLCRTFHLPSLISLGALYYVYMGLLAVFCTNSINIYAGVNGLEVGQSLVICFFVMMHNVMEIVKAEAFFGPIHYAEINAASQCCWRSISSLC
eukprot:GHVS01040980.1.p1 GENE.GHVS01040980.1~~GHVS01040980.1.p1  ORF type:complete len:292 (+),score=52.55 GHVS01040980.1:84-959(+)